MRELPRWVYDVVMALDRWADEHPTLFVQHFADGYVRAERCGCEAHGKGDRKPISTFTPVPFKTLVNIDDYRCRVMWPWVEVEPVPVPWAFSRRA